MYIKKKKGPLLVALEDGSMMSRADLPPPTTKRWVASRKAAVVRGVENGLIKMEEACEIYALSEEELACWVVRTRKHGETALKSTSLQKYRQL